MIDIVALLNSCIENALKCGSSDIHFETKLEGIFVKFRVDGLIVEDQIIEKDYASQFFSRLKVLIKGDMTKKNIPQEGRFSFESRVYSVVDIRVIIIPTVLGEKATLRILHRKDLLRSLSSLGMLPDMQNTFSSLLASRHGLVLICGATGSGKTTTMYASLLEIKSKKLNIVTIEDPVEYIVEDINQIQFNNENELSFASVLRYVLRMDPDVIFIGEIRDAQTAALACSAALTGHLVVATIHANDSITAVTRLYDMGVEPFMIAHSLLGATCQTLVPTLCVACNGEGCAICGNRGINGRTAFFEMMTMNRELRELFVKPPYSLVALQKAANASFFQSMRDGARQKCRLGMITEKELFLLEQGAADL